MAKRRKVRRKPRRAASRSIPHWAVALLLLALGAGLYLNTLGHGFVFDDRPLILQNPQVTQQNYLEMFTPGRGYRPVRTLTYAVNYAIGGEDPYGYHLFNILLHGLNGVLLFYLIRLWSGSLSGSAAAAVLFLAHPVQTGAVAYISGRKDLLAAFFVFCGLYAYTRFRQSGEHWRLAAAVLLFGLGFLSKEVVIAVPALLLTADALWLRRRFRQEEQAAEGDKPSFRQSWVAAFRRSPWIYAGALAAAAAALYYAVFITRASRMIGYWGGTVLTNLGTSFKLFAYYVKMVLWPHPQLADYKGDIFPISTGLAEPATMLSILVSAAFAALAVWIYRRSALASVGLLWFAVFLLPVLHFIPFHEIAAEHFLYLPLAGIGLAVGDLLSRLSWEPAAGKAAWAAFAALAVAGSAVAVERNEVWKNSRTLWEDTLAKEPESYRALANLGRIYFDQKRDPLLRRKGLEMTRKAVELVPDNQVAKANLGSFYFDISRERFQAGDLESARDITLQAIELLEQALEADANSGSVLNNLGNCHNQLARIARRRGDSRKASQHAEMARKQFEKALRSDPRKETKAAHYNLAVLYSDQGDWKKAKAELEKFISHYPDFADARSRLGIILLEREGKYREAIPHLRAAVRRKPVLDNFSYLAEAYHRNGEYDRAIAVYHEVMRRFPKVWEVHYNLAGAYLAKGETDLAIRYYQVYANNGGRAELVAAARKRLESLKARKAKENVSR